jgi:hypothetical protein
VFNAEIFNIITGKCPEVDIEIENQPIKSLIATGSQVSTISESFFFKQFIETETNSL